MSLIAILIKIDSRGPVLYTPQMIGRNGRPFRLLRFRTMHVQGAHTKPNWTRVGSFLRDYSLDHLPALMNILKGDLTLVGPRPMEIDAVDMENPAWQKYVQATPGLFNIAVLKLGKAWGPSRTSHPTLNQELELDYFKMRSVRSDLKLLRTSIQAYISSRGNIKARGEPDAETQQRLNG